MPGFKNGVSVNRCGNGGKYKRLRIRAGPHRGRYVDEMVLEAKLGRPLGEGMTVEHRDGNTMNVSWDNLIEVTHSENSQLMHKRRAKADDEVPF